MTERLRCGTKNPQLLQFEEDFRLSEFAFVVECSSWAAPFLLARNPSAIIPRYGELEIVEFVAEEDRETPFNDSNPTGWLFPRWRPQKVLYFFGTLSSQCDVCLPTEKQISRRHFAIYLSQSGLWTVRNLSRYGTWVNGDLLGVSLPGEPVVETALNPDCQNEIRVGLLEFLLHPIPHAPLESQSNMAASLLLGLGKPSEGTRTTSATESAYVVSRPASSQTEPYFYLRDRPIVVQGGSEVCAAIHKRSSLYYLAKLYESDESWDKANAQYEMMLSFTNHTHIVFYSEWLLTETGAKIISPHLDAVPLCELLTPHGQIHDIEMAFMVYKQMAEALGDLRDHGVVHNDINDSTILVELQEGGRYVSYLTGFSEYSYADAKFGEAFGRDLSDLTKIIEKMLPIRRGLPCCDPELRALMLETHEGQIQAKELCTALNTLAPEFERTRFQRTLLTTEMSLGRVVDDDGTEAVRLLDVLRIILHERPQYLKDVEIAVKKVIRTENLFQLEGDTYCSLYDAEKLLHHLHRAKHTRLLGLAPPTHSGARFYQTTHEGGVMVSYHELSGMVNMTQILNLFDTETVETTLTGFDLSNLREIRGSPQWEGYYVHRSVLGEILSRLPVPVKHYAWDDNPQCYPVDKFFGSEDTISIATDEMINLILFNRKNEVVTWGNQTLTIHDAIKLSEDHGLPVVRDNLIRITSASLSSSSIFYSDEDIMRLFDQADDSDYPTEATSHNSFQSQDTIRFTPKRKKHKRNSDIPILPVQRKALAKEEIPPIKKVEEWVAAGPDIRPTRFITSSQKTSQGSRRR